MRGPAPLRALAIFAVLFVPSVAAAAPAEEIRERARVMLEQGYQRELPASDGAFVARETQAADDRTGLGVPEPVSSVADLLLWCLLVGAVAVVLLALGRSAMAARGRHEEALAPGGAGSASGPAIVAIDDAEELAREGRFAEAIHVLLARVVAHLAAGGRTDVAPSTTAREVLARAPLDATSRAAFSNLVLAVEVSLFGGVAVEASDYARCVDSFRRLESALARRS